jgi:hypothetical protein
LKFDLIVANTPKPSCKQLQVTCSHKWNGCILANSTNEGIASCVGKNSEVLCYGMRVLFLKMVYLSISFQYFFTTCFFFPPTHLQAQTQWNLFKHSLTSTLEGNGGKTQNLIIYKQANAHVQNVL